MVHLIDKLHLKAKFVYSKYIYVIGFATKNVILLCKAGFKPPKKSVRSQKSCVKIPKKMPCDSKKVPDDPKKMCDDCQACFLGSFLRSQKTCRTFSCT